MKFMRKTTALFVFALMPVVASVAAAENIVAPGAGTFPALTDTIPATGAEFNDDLTKKLAELEILRKGNMLRIIEQRDAFAAQLERAGLAEGAAKNRALSAQYRETPLVPPPGGSEIPLKTPAAPHVLSAMPELLSQPPQSIAIESLVVWGAIGVLWMVALAGLRGLRQKTKLRRLAWLLAVPAVSALLLAAAALRPALDGRELLPAFFAPGNFLALLLCALAYLAIRLFRKKAWKRGFALVGGVALALGLVALGATVGMAAIPEEIGGVKITGEKHIDSSGAIVIERIASDEGYNVAWSVNDLRVRFDAAALMWGHLRGVDIHIGEIDVFIDRSKQSPPKKEGGDEGEKEPMTIERVIDYLRSLGGVEIEKIVVRMARKGKEPLTIFEGGTSVTRYSSDEIGGEITGRILSMSNLTVKWRGDMARHSIVTQYDFGTLALDTDTLARLVPEELGIDLAASGWNIGGGLGVSGEVKLAEGGKPEWFADVRLNAGVLRWPGLPLPMIDLGGAIFIDENGASVHGLRGRIATDQYGTPPSGGMGEFAMSGEIDMSGNGLLEVVSTGFPISEGWLTMLAGGQGWIERLGLTGYADFRSTLRVSLRDGVPTIENIRTEIMPSRLLVSPVEPKVNVGIDLMTLLADGDGVNLLLGDSNLAGGKLFGNSSASLADMTNSSGWIAFKDVQFHQLQGVSSDNTLEGLMHGKLEVKDATLQSAESFAGTIWIKDINTSVDPILSKLFAKLVSQIGVAIPDSDTCDVYCIFAAGKDGLTIRELRAFSGVLRIDAEGTIDYAGNLELNGSVRLGSSLLAKIPGLGGILGDILGGKKFGLTRFQIGGNYAGPKITIDPLSIVSGLKEQAAPSFVPEKKPEDRAEP